MDFLPKDPAILVSSVNMLLRDEEFDTLEALCYAFSRDPKQIKEYLYKRGFVWSEQQKQFRPIGYPSKPFPTPTISSGVSIRSSSWLPGLTGMP